MSFFANVQDILLLLIAVFQFGVAGFAFLDAAGRRADAYLAAGKLKKPIWLAILGASIVVVVALFLRRDPFSLPNLAATVAAIVYLVDVRPAIKQVTGRGGGNGPYG